MTVQIGLFAKHWTPGQTKTRLAASVGAELAAECSRQFLRTTLDRLSPHGDSHRIAFAPSDERLAFEGLLESLPCDWRREPQPTGDLGARMDWFFHSALDSGNEAALLLGSDSPDFPHEAVADGLAWLNRPGAKLVLGPAEDGGYWCVGASGCVPPIFDQMPWSEPNLLEKTLKRLKQLGWQRGQDYQLLSEWYDVDTLEDLQQLRARLTQTSSADQALERLRSFLDNLVD